MIFLNVERHSDEDHALILRHQKEKVLAAGGEWLDPSVRLQREQDEADRKAESVRQEELRQRCVRKGLDFEKEESKYQDRQKILLSWKRKLHLEQ